MAGATLLTVTGTQVVGTEVAARRTTDTGFSRPFSGTPWFEYLAPTQATRPDQINQPIGLEKADEIARKLRLKRKHVLTVDQFELFITGGGAPGSGNADDAALADRSVQIFTNTVDRPLRYLDERGDPVETVLASYGLFVNDEGWLMSLANLDAPTRIANVLLEPGGYINTWFPPNGATRSLIQLYTSGYTLEALFGNWAQQRSGIPQLVTNRKGAVRTEVGMSMAPALWLTNFALLYTLRPEIAAKMPAYWTPIPSPVADAILASPTGQVLYREYAHYFPSTS
ncbi:MAG: hypothetical protein QNM02_14265 [Acidimicrobiia bacterium]|nr:hypothetical protein [Acidimicrobiia bacterium]